MERYSRQTMLPEIGEAGQLKLKAAKVLIVGVGGLGSPIALYLAGAGVGTIGLADDDEVSLSNLQRQILYTEEEVGDLKAICASMRISALNREIKVNACPGRLSKENARDLIGQYDIIVDGCDNFATRYLLSDVCSELGKPYVYGAICGFEGQVSVFNYGEGTQPGRRRNVTHASSSQGGGRSDTGSNGQCGSMRSSQNHLWIRRGPGRQTMDN